MRTLFFYLFIIFIVTSCASHNTLPIEQQPETIMRLADISAQAGDLERSEHFYKEASLLLPHQTQPLLKLGAVQNERGNHLDAISSYKKVLAIEANNHEAKYKLAETFLLLGELDAALTHYNSLLNQNIKDHHALNGLGVLLDTLSEHKTAQFCYKQGLKYAPEDFSLLNNYGLSFALSGEFDTARHYLKLSTKRTSTIKTHNNLTLINQYYHMASTENAQDKNKKKLMLQNKIMDILQMKTKSPSLMQSSALYAAQKYCFYPIS